MSQMIPRAPVSKTPVPQAEVPSLMVPQQGRPLLVPNIAVAEIVPFSAPLPEVGKPQWFLGHIMWRGEKVPVISVVQLRGEEEDIPSEARIAVFNGLGGALRFYGVITHGIPRLVRVREQDIESTDGMYTSVDDAFVAVGGELAVIPNLIQIETMIAGV
ncbi:MAG: chemotaxis protein CheW [Pseudomonadota bacterium]